MIDFAERHFDCDASDVRSIAFREACSKRTPEEQMELNTKSGVREMFSHLSDTNIAHQSESIFRRGVRRLSPVVLGLNRLVDVADPITNFEPAAASGLAIVKSVAAVGDYTKSMPDIRANSSQIAIAICGAESQIQDSIEELLDHIPLIDRCDEIEMANPTSAIGKVSTSRPMFLSLLSRRRTHSSFRPWSLCTVTSWTFTLKA